MRFQQASQFKLPVGAHHRIGIDLQVDCQLPYRGQLVAWGQGAGSDSAAHLVDQLAVNRHSMCRSIASWNRDRPFLPMCISVL